MFGVGFGVMMSSALARFDYSAEIAKLVGQLKSNSDKIEQRELYYKIGDLYVKSFRETKDPSDAEKAAFYYENPISEGDLSLNGINSRILFASILNNDSQYEKKMKLLRVVIEAKPEAVISSELNEHLIDQLSILNPMDMTLDATGREQLIAKRIDGAKVPILEYFEKLQESAIKIEVDAVSRKKGIRGLEKLLKRRKDNPYAVDSIKRALVDLASRP